MKNTNQTLKAAPSLDDQILAAIGTGATSRAQLMAIDTLRLMTWSRIADRLKAMCGSGVLIESKSGWRLA